MLTATIQQVDPGQSNKVVTAIDHEMLVCESCDRRLVDIVVVGDAGSAEPTQYKANCPFCGDCSQVAELPGLARFMAEHGVYVVDVVVDESPTNRFTIRTEIAPYV